MIDQIPKLKIGDIVYISDEKSLARYKSVQKIQCVVDAISVFSIIRASVSCRILSLKDDKDGIFYLILSQVNSLDEVSLYFNIDAITQGCNRKDLLDNDIKWLFAPPKDFNNFKPSDLEFTEDIVQGEVIYQRKFPTVYGELRTGSNIEFCSLTKYGTKSEDIDNKDVILLEVGWTDSKGNKSPDGGSLRLMDGYVVQNNDLDFLTK